MGWLEETPWEVPAAFGEYGGFGRMVAGVQSEHSGRLDHGPMVHMLDETAFLLLFTSVLVDSTKLFAWPGDIAPNGAAVLRAAVEVVEVMDLTEILSSAFIEAVQALPDGGGYAVYVGGTGVG